MVFVMEALRVGLKGPPWERMKADNWVDHLADLKVPQRVENWGACLVVSMAVQRVVLKGMMMVELSVDWKGHKWVGKWVLMWAAPTVGMRVGAMDERTAVDSVGPRGDLTAVC
jgi:hypothetical protein